MIPALEIPHDPVLPQLPLALDAGLMAQEFERRIFGSGEKAGSPLRGRFRVESCRIERIKYKPGHKCTIGYVLSVQDRKTLKIHHQRLCGRIFKEGGSLPRYRKATHQPLVRPRFGPPLMHFEWLDIVVWAFPNERKLAGLSALTDTGRLKRRILPEIVRARWGAEWRIVDLVHSIANYVPESRCCVRVHLKLFHPRTRECRLWVIYGKIYGGNRGEKAHLILQHLWNSQARVRGEVGIPRPLGYQRAHRVFWQEGLEGQTLTAEELSLVHLRSAAEAIANLHCTPITCGASAPVEHILRQVHGDEALLARAHPSCETILSNLVCRLRAQFPNLNREITAAIHGDLHPKNIFFDGTRVSLIDLDNVSQGPPLSDIGTFIAYMLYQKLLHGEEASTARPSIECFVRCYEDRVPWAVTRAEIAWYTAAALIVRASRCVTRLKSGRMEIVDGLIRLADEISRGNDEVGISGKGRKISDSRAD